MTDLLVPKMVKGTKLEKQQAIKKYEQPNLLKATWQLVATFIHLKLWDEKNQKMVGFKSVYV